MKEDLKKKGLYYAEDISSALAQFRDRVPHDLIVIDGNSIKGEDLEKNLIKLSNRILVIYESSAQISDDKINELQKQRKIVVAKKNEIGNWNEVDELYNKLRFLWIAKFFNISNSNIELYLCGLGGVPHEEKIKSDWKLSENNHNITDRNLTILIESKVPNGGIIDPAIMIAHHNAYFSKINKFIQDSNLCKTIISKSFYYETWGKGSYLSFIFNSPPKNDIEYQQRILEFIEMGLLKIIILDERIAEKATEKNFTEDVRLWKMLNLQQVYVVTHLIKDGGKKAISPKIKEEANTLKITRVNDNLQIELNGKGINNKFHCFIGHKTLLNNPDFYPYLGVKDDLKKWIDEMGKHIPFIILDSGRGEVDIPQNAKFLPYSYIEEVIIENTSKYKLTQTILKLTRKAEEGR
jgi:hypothetical protein